MQLDGHPEQCPSQRAQGALLGRGRLTALSAGDRLADATSWRLADGGCWRKLGVPDAVSTGGTGLRMAGVGPGSTLRMVMVTSTGLCQVV